MSGTVVVHNGFGNKTRVYFVCIYLCTCWALSILQWGGQNNENTWRGDEMQSNSSESSDHVEHAVLQISATHWWNFFKFGAIVNLDSRMEWFKFGGERSKTQNTFHAITTDCINNGRSAHWFICGHLKPRVWILAVAILFFWSQKRPYLQKRATLS